MRKHYKLISSIACLILCVCMVTFGVYAASYGLVNLNSTVSFTPTMAKLKIFGGIAGQANYAQSLTEHAYYACNYGEGKGNYTSNSSGDVFTKWSYGKIYFAEYAETGTEAKPDPISFYIQITNYVEADVNYTITINNPTDKFEYSFHYYSADNNSSGLNNPTGATAAGWWYVGGTSASKPTFYNNETKPTSTNVNFTTGTNTKVVDLKDVDTTLKTIMMIITIQVVNADVDIDGDTTGFNFTIGANVGTN